jgi:Tfp pilus assembly protein PilN
MSKHRSPAINLIPQDPFFDSMVGRTLQWGMGAGRYIVIFTEIVVILSFAARFTLDRQITDLNTKLISQITQLEGRREDEAAFRLAQAQVDEVNQSLNASNILDVFASVNKVVPLDITLNKMSITQDGISVEGTANTQAAFITFINNLQLTPQFNSVAVGKIETAKDNEQGMAFTVTAATRLKPTVAKKPAASPNSTAKPSSNTATEPAP